MTKIYDIYKQLEQRNVILSFKGLMTSELLTTLLQIMESKMDRFEDRQKIKKKVFNVLVECLQNLYHHIDENIDDLNTAQNERNSLFMIAKTEGDYTIMTGNYMKPVDVPNLKERLDLINRLSKDELKEFYKTVLNEGNMSSKGTAGLGMIDIARKSGRELQYEFTAIHEHLAFFSLSVRVEE